MNDMNFDEKVEVNDERHYLLLLKYPKLIYQIKILKI